MSEAKSSKSGRNKAYCAAYKLSNKATFNKAIRIHSHLRRYGPNDTTAVSALNLCIKSDSLTSKALKGVSLPLGKATYTIRSVYHAKRYAKAKRQHAKAEASGNEAACMKAAFYVIRFAP